MLLNSHHVNHSCSFSISSSQYNPTNLWQTAPSMSSALLEGRFYPKPTTQNKSPNLLAQLCKLNRWCFVERKVSNGQICLCQAPLYGFLISRPRRSDDGSLLEWSNENQTKTNTWRTFIAFIDVKYKSSITSS